MDSLEVALGDPHRYEISYEAGKIARYTGNGVWEIWLTPKRASRRHAGYKATTQMVRERHRPGSFELDQIDLIVATYPFIAR